jgi:ABC-type oligopeptide transport system substrate-binding subunit
MQQAAEIPRVALNPHRQAFELPGILLRCGILLAVIASTVGCTGHDGNARFQGDMSNSVRVLRRGLPGEPRTLDPQLAEDTFSFPVLRDLYEGLTAEDRGRPVPFIRSCSGQMPSGPMARGSSRQNSFRAYGVLSILKQLQDRPHCWRL